MRVGILELLLDEAPSRSWLDRAYRAVFKKQYASITPQAVAVWCRQLGHQVRYATYYGQEDPHRLLPDDLDVLFVSTYTQASALAYALARLYTARNVLTVIGGPHARSFPLDCLRFFDLVVRDCDKDLIGEILRGAFDPGSIVDTGRPLTRFPSVEERAPEIVASAFSRGRPVSSSTVPLIASIGCPYSCEFCIDWRRPYFLLPAERLEADLRYVSTRWPGVMVSYHDPNFAVRFDEVLDVMEAIPRAARPPYIMESSLSVLRPERLGRLRETNCIYVAPGVESWAGYSAKAGVSHARAAEKLDRLRDHFRILHGYGIGLQANFIFGTDEDRGDEPVRLTGEFIRSLPFVWPTVNVPTPFGGTPLYDAALGRRRLLRAMPLSFYYTPYLVTTPRNYEPVDYYTKLIRILSAVTPATMLGRRLLTRTTPGIKVLHILRTLGVRQDLAACRRIRGMLAASPRFRAFHEGRSDVLPEFYHREYERRLGRYASLLSRVDRTPVLEPPSAARAVNTAMDAREPGPRRPDAPAPI